MKAHSTRLLALCSLPVLAACADEAAGPSGASVAINVAPLSLPGTLGVEYALAVFNAAPVPATIFNPNGTVLTTTGLVWEQDSVTSNQFGNDGGGDISYVGPCDASLTAPSTNYVALALRQVYVGTGLGSEHGTGPYATGIFLPLSKSVLDDQNSANGVSGDPLPNDADPDFENPCPYDAPCLLPFPCIENQDVSVVFNLTIMRDAEQGFFDIAVNFEDIFCSAKVDCSYDDAGVEPIEILFGADGKRHLTAMFAVACTHGAGNVGTVLHMNGARVECGEDLGVATVPRALVQTCTSDSDLYGAVLGSTKASPEISLPVAWKDVAGVPTALALPTGNKEAGVVFATLDANNLAGFTGSALAARAAGALGDYANLADRANGVDARGRGMAMQIADFVIWNRASEGAPWVLANSYALPEGFTLNALTDASYDAVTGRMWLNLAKNDGAAAGPAYFEKNATGWTFTAGPALGVPAGYPFCYVNEVKGGLAVGKCSANAQATAMATVQKPGASVGVPSEATLGAVWAVAGGAPTVLPVAGLFTNPTWTAVTPYIVNDTRIIGTAWNDMGSAKVVEWAYGGSAWDPTVLVGATENASIAWKHGLVMAISSNSADIVWRWSGTDWDSWASSKFTGVVGAFQLSGYASGPDVLFGLVETGATKLLQPWWAALPARDGDIVMERLPLSGADALSFSYAGKFSTATALTLLFQAQDALQPRTFAYRRIDADGAWSGAELKEFADSAVIKVPAFMTTAEPVQPCDPMLGTVVDGATKAELAATWALAESVTPIVPTAYPVPVEILPANAQVGTFVSFDLDPTIVGNAWDPPHAGDAVWQYAMYSGSEALLCDGEPCQKVYWNSAIGFDPTMPGCRLIAEATAAPNPGLVGGTTPNFNTYPMIAVDVPLTSTPEGTDPVELLCFRHPLNAGDEVKTIYTSVDTPQQFCHRFDGTTASTYPGCEWTPYAQQLIARDVWTGDALPAGGR